MRRRGNNAVGAAYYLCWKGIRFENVRLYKKSALGARKAAFFFLFAALLAPIVFFPSASAAGAFKGLMLSGNVLIPSLFPFMVLSAWATKTGLFSGGGRFSRFAVAVFNLPTSALTPLLSGWLCGYPAGARAAVGEYEAGRLTKAETERLLTFCVCVSPQFAVGALGASMLGNARGTVRLSRCAFILPDYRDNRRAFRQKKRTRESARFCRCTRGRAVFPRPRLAPMFLSRTAHAVLTAAFALLFLSLDKSDVSVFSAGLGGAPPAAKVNNVPTAIVMLMTAAVILLKSASKTGKEEI